MPLSPAERDLPENVWEYLFSTRLPNCFFPSAWGKCLSSAAKEGLNQLDEVNILRSYCPTFLAQTDIEKKVWQRTRKIIREAKGTFSVGIGLKQWIVQLLDLGGHKSWAEVGIK